MSYGSWSFAHNKPAPSEKNGLKKSLTTKHATCDNFGRKRSAPTLKVNESLLSASYWRSKVRYHADLQATMLAHADDEVQEIHVGSLSWLLLGLKFRPQITANQGLVPRVLIKRTSTWTLGTSILRRQLSLLRKRLGPSKKKKKRERNKSQFSLFLHATTGVPILWMKRSGLRRLSGNKMEYSQI